MMHCTPHHRGSLMARGLLLLFVGGSVAGCDGLLEVDDPIAVLEDRVNSPIGAELLRRSALTALFRAVESSARESGLLADEFRYEQPPWVDGFSFPFDDQQLFDMRASLQDQDRLEFGAVTAYAQWQAVRSRHATIAIEKLRRYALPGAREAHVGEMLAVRAWAAMRLAENHCPGFPLHEVVDFDVILGPAVTTEEAFAYALARFDSVLTWAADSARVLNFALVGRARTLLQLGRFADAASAATAVPSAYVYQASYGDFQENNLAATGPFGDQWGSPTGRSVADGEGGNGLDFVSANDPRVPTVPKDTARDGVTPFYGLTKYPSYTSPIPIATGLEARLIEAEAALQAGDPNWLTILNTLRADQGLGPLADPGTPAARLDLLFRERAFWLFATGTRLGDLRRLVRVYGRPSESVFPTAAYWRGGSYGPSTNLPIDRSERDTFGFWCTG